MNNVLPARLLTLAALAAVYFAAAKFGLAFAFVNASVGVATLTLGGFARLEDFGPIWSTWWLGDAAGDLIVAPMLILPSGDTALRMRTIVTHRGELGVAPEARVREPASG
jgi:hypothetical protein